MKKMNDKTPWRAWWAYASLAAAATTFTVISAVMLARVDWQARRDPLWPLIAASSESAWRPFEARLADFEYGALSTSSSLAAITIRSSAYKLAKRFDASTTAAETHAAGVAALIAQDPSAIPKLRAAITRQADEARYWNDLGAALLTRARAEDNPHELAEALAAVNRSLQIDANRADARFNRALILERLSLWLQARDAWDAFLRVDGASRWSEEGRRHRETCRARAAPPPLFGSAFEHPTGGNESILAPVLKADPEKARRFGETVLLANWAHARAKGSDREAAAWLNDARVIGALLRRTSGETLLSDAVAAVDRCRSGTCGSRIAEAHRIYDTGRKKYHARLIAEALADFRAAERMFGDGGSPMRLVAAYYALNCLEDHNNNAVFSRLEKLLSVVPAEYLALRAQILWTMGENRARVGRPAAAVETQRRALAQFTRLGERGNVLLVQNAVAALESLLGRPQAAWRLRVKSFDAYGEHTAPAAVQQALELAGRTEAIEGHWEAATALFDLATEPRLRINPRIDVSAMMWSALAHERVGMRHAAQQQLEKARTVADRIQDASLREVALGDLSFAEASVTLRADPVRAAGILDRYLASATMEQRMFLAADALLLRARTARAIGNVTDAEHYYRAALITADEQRRDAFARGIVDAYLSTGTAAVDELAELFVSQERRAEAFAVIENGRGRAVLQRFERSAPVVATMPRLDSIPDGTLVVSFLPLHDETVIFSVKRAEGLRVTRTPHGVGELRALVEQLRREIVTGNDAAADAAGERVHDALFAPLTSALHRTRALAVVDDPVMRDVPLAMIRDRATGKRLIERFALMRVPSATVFANSLTHNGGESQRVIIIGDPAFDRMRFPGLRRLPAARREAQSVARLYPQADVWLGEDATAARFVDALDSARIIHIAAHGTSSRVASLESSLLLASGSVSAEQIVRSSCSAEVVVLAACRTAVGSEAVGDIHTIASAFVVAGARNVVGTLWNISDDEALEFSRRFHERLLAGATPAVAVQEAQRDLLGVSPLRGWSAFTLTASGR